MFCYQLRMFLYDGCCDVVGLYYALNNGITEGKEAVIELFINTAILLSIETYYSQPCFFKGGY
jgi:hypothetical protein